MLRKNSKKRGEGNGADGGEGLVVVPHSDSLSGKGLHNSDSIPVKKGSNTDRPKAKGKKKEKQYAKSTAHQKSTAKRFFVTVVYRQRLQAHARPIWTMKFNHDGGYLATGGDEIVVKVWKVTEQSSGAKKSFDSYSNDATEDPRHYFEETPYRIFSGHEKEIVDLDWSGENFLLSASMDQTVRLWHLSKNECLRKFEHLDIVSTVRFNPLDNTIFLSCAFNGTVHLWSILKNAYLSTVSAEDYVTCSAISHDGKLAMVGTVHGHVKLYSVHNEISGQWKLKEITQIDIRPERSKDVKTNAEEALVKNKSRKVTGIEISPSGKEFLITANDSHVRRYMMNDKSLIRLYRGHPNEYSNLRGTYRGDERFVMCASDSSTLSIWDIDEQPSLVQKGRNKVDLVVAFESVAIEEEKTGGKDRLTAALFAPGYEPDSQHLRSENLVDIDYAMIAADHNGVINVLQNRGAFVDTQV